MEEVTVLGTIAVLNIKLTTGLLDSCMPSAVSSV